MITTTLTNRLFDTDNNLAKKAIMVAAGVMALAISAKVQFPTGFWLPGTMQLLFVMVIGAAYGMRMGAATVASYLALGIAGAPIFAYGGGAAYFIGPTGGYLVGFLVAAALVGALAERGMDRNIVTMAVAMIAGVLVCHAFGSTWLVVLSRHADAMNWFTGFIMFDLIKVAAAVIAFPLIWKMIGEQR